LSDKSEDVEALIAAAKKLREEAGEAEVAMGKTIVKSEDIVESKKKMTFDEAFKALSAVKTSEYDSLKSITSRFDDPPPSTMNLKPFPLTLDGLSQRTGGQITAEALGVGGEDDVSLDDFKYATIAVTLASSVLAIAAGVIMPNNTGATFTYLFAVIPVLWIAVGSSAPGILAGLIETFKGSNEDADKKRERICYHEAAHFLCGYLVGLPVKSYGVGEDGYPFVEFFDTKMGDLREEENGRKVEFEMEQVSKLAVVSMAGSVGEAIKLETAKGGDNDLLALQSIFSKSEEFIGAAKQQEITRWGALMAWIIIKENKEAFEKLTEAVGEGKSVEECAAIIECS